MRIRYCVYDLFVEFQDDPNLWLVVGDILTKDQSRDTYIEKAKQIIDERIDGIE